MRTSIRSSTERRSTIRSFWWRTAEIRNFGDELTPLLLKHFAGIKAEWTLPHLSEIVVCGSILGDVPLDYRGIILGAGKMNGDLDKRAFSFADVRVLRGPLTGSAPVYADPGLLAGLLPYRKSLNIVEQAVLPHYIDKHGLEKEFGHHIDITDDPIRVIEKVAACERVVTSSLHGLILADSLGLPRRWVPCADVLGDGFKFRDYGASIGWDAEPYRWFTADQAVVREKQQQLIEEFARLSVRGALKALEDQ